MFYRFFLLVFLAIAGTLSAGVTNLQRGFLRERVKIVRRDTATLPGYVINHFRRGISAEWCETNRLAVVNQQINRPRKLSKLKLITAIKKRNRWYDVLNYLKHHDYYDEWVACQFIATGHPIFEEAKRKIVQFGLFGMSEINAIIEESYDDEF